jgi:hypothetical protein
LGRGQCAASIGSGGGRHGIGSCWLTCTVIVAAPGVGHDRRGAVNEDRPAATDGRLTVASEEADGGQEERGRSDD